jgi:hypothetical protein
MLVLEIANERFKEHSSRVTYLQADLVNNSWEESEFAPADAIVSTWALHDLGSPENVCKVYQRSHDTLRSGGVLLNGDFVKPDGAPQEFEGGRFYIAQHFELLDEVGFSNASCLSNFEIEIEILLQRRTMPVSRLSAKIESNAPIEPTFDSKLVGRRLFLCSKLRELYCIRR